MAIGLALLCKEDMEIINLNIYFKEGKKYLAVPQQDGIWVVDENHVPIKLTDKQLLRHFEQS